MDSLDVGNLPNIYGNQGGMLVIRSYGESPDFDDYINNSSLSISGDARSRIFIGPNSDDDDRYKFFMVCAENKINALIERVREFNDNFGREDELEDEAVAMAIRQHGLRKNESTSNISVYGGINTDEPTTSTSIGDEEEGAENVEVDDYDDDCVSNRKIKRKRHHEWPNTDGFDIDDLYFLNKAVAAAIEQKGLCSSTLGALK